LPGGAASLIGHVVGVPIVLAAGWSLFGVDMFAMIAVIAVLAIAMLFAFEYSTAARLFLMQIGIVPGFLTGYPAVALLLDAAPRSPPERSSAAGARRGLPPGACAFRPRRRAPAAAR